MLRLLRDTLDICYRDDRILMLCILDTAPLLNVNSAATVGLCELRGLHRFILDIERFNIKGTLRKRS